MSKVEAYENNGQVMTYSPQDIINQVAQISALMNSVMKVDEHYGQIPGTGKDAKPTLLKPGAEKVQVMFRLAPMIEGDDKPTNYGNGHIGYTIKTTLVHIPTGQVWGQGVGSCSTLETKYRYRNDMKKDEDGKWVQVPKAYWKERDPAAIGGKEWSTIKKGSTWYICRRVEHENPADYYNTVLKIGKKRSMVDATLTATAASDFFTQDIEDLVANGLIEADDSKMENMRRHETLKQKSTYEGEVVDKKQKKEPEMSDDEFNDKRTEFEFKMLAYFENQGDSDPAKRMTEWMKGRTELKDKKTGKVEIKGFGTVDGIRSVKQLNFLKSKFKEDHGIDQSDWDDMLSKEKQ
jgi:hypothetical protein